MGGAEGVEDIEEAPGEVHADSRVIVFYQVSILQRYIMYRVPQKN